jgi:hypothetical protein
MKTASTLKTRLGRCYELADKYVIDHPNSILVHGSICGTQFIRDLKRIGHAWTEENGIAFDPVTEWSMPKESYLQIMNAKEEKRYTYNQASSLMLGTKHFGPWPTIENELMEDYLARYAGLPLECDGLTRVIDFILEKNGIRHKTFAGEISYKDKSIIHYWIQLEDGRIIDYRARMWLGKRAPHGVFKLSKHSPIKYKGIVYPLHISENLFKILTMERTEK